LQERLEPIEHRLSLSRPTYEAEALGHRDGLVRDATNSLSDGEAVAFAMKEISTSDLAARTAFSGYTLSSTGSVLEIIG
jgi:hypothetical protein